MARVNPPNITPAPTPAPQRGDRPTFSDRVDAFVLWLTAAVAQFQALATNVYNNALDAWASAGLAADSVTAAAQQAANAATSAQVAATASNAAAWVSGTTYAVGTVVYSPINKRSYRRATAGAGVTDPSVDKVNWVLLSNIPYGMSLIATIDVVEAATIDLLNLFTSDYNNYRIIIEGVRPTASSRLQMRVANSGVADATASSYGIDNNSYNSIPDISLLINASSRGVSGIIEMVNMNSADGAKVVLLNLMSDGGGYGPGTNGKNSVTYVQPGAVTGFRLYWAGGNFQAFGKIRVYGYANTN